MSKIDLVIISSRAESYVQRIIQSHSIGLFSDIIVVRNTSIPLVENYSKSGVQVVYCDFGRHVNKARHLGLQRTSTEWVLLLDDDDLLEAPVQKVKDGLSELNSNVDLYTLPGMVVDSGGSIERLLNKELLFLGMPLNVGGFSRIIFRSNQLLKASFLQTDQLTAFQDIGLIMHMISRKDLKVESLMCGLDVKYEIADSGQSISSDKRAMIKSAARLMQQVICMSLPVRKKLIFCIFILRGVIKRAVLR